MSVELYLFLLLLSVILTILLTEALKRLINSTDIPYRTNAIVLDSAMISSTLVSIILKEYLKLGLSFSATQLVRLLLVILSTWFASMMVYDKIVQTVHQYKKYKLDKQEKEDKENVEKLCIQAIDKYNGIDKSSGNKGDKPPGADSPC